MLNSPSYQPIKFPESQRPLLLVTVDTEEEFDWTKPHSCRETSVTHIPAQERAQDLYRRFSVRPTYVVDYPVAEQEYGYKPLREWASGGTCEIGAHLHPWVNPPFDEEICNRHSFPGNLPAALERAKLHYLTDLIADRFGSRPTVYRAGRYGVGSATSAILEELGYQIDSSVLPRTNLTSIQGPDFSGRGQDPYWFGQSGRLLEIPVTVGWDGWMTGAGMLWQKLAESSVGRAAKVQGFLSLTGAFNRVKLTPEGIPLVELRQVTDAMLVRGYRVFNLTYHSPSLVPGHTPYVRTTADLEAFLSRIEGYLEYFFGRCNGLAATPHQVRDLCQKIGNSGGAA